MIKSMTGFGRRQESWSEGTVSVEVRSVNHRFLESSIRMPKSMSGLEERFKKAIQQQCVRGRVDLTVSLQGSRGSTRAVQLDVELAKQYHHALRTLQRTLKLKGSIDIGLMAGFRDIIALSEQPTDDPKLIKVVEKLGLLAVSDMTKMREKEGALLAQDILARLDQVRECSSAVSSRAPHIAQEAFRPYEAASGEVVGRLYPRPPSAQSGVGPLCRSVRHYGRIGQAGHAYDTV